MPDQESRPPTDRALRAASVAYVLARGVREGELVVADVLRILRHELRRLNTNRKDKLRVRSLRAQEVIDHYAKVGEPVPKNSSDDALHADHVYPLTADAVAAIRTVDGWLTELKRVGAVVCLTAKENYELEKIELTGMTGPEKYVAAGIKFTSDGLPWIGDGATTPG